MGSAIVSCEPEQTVTNDDNTVSEREQLRLPYRAKVGVLLGDTRSELAEAAVVLIACIVFALETLPGLSYDQGFALSVIEYGSCVSFAFLYLLRWYAASFSPAHVFKPIEIIDLLSFVPLLSQPFDPDPNGALGSGFEVLRLLRIVRLQRFVADEESFLRLTGALGLGSSTAFKQVSQRQLQLYLRVARVVGSIVTLLLVATGLVYECEHLVNPMIPTFFDALYFGLTTLTTVGFGDITPVTLGGRLVVSGAIILGLAIVPAQLAELGQTLLAADAVADADAYAPPRVGAPALKRGVDALLKCDACGEPRHLRASSFCHTCGAKLSVLQVETRVVRPVADTKASAL